MFTISRVLKTNPVTYVLKDSGGDELRAGCYHEEIQKASQKTVFRIETILQERRSVGGRREYLVRWYGYPPHSTVGFPTSCDIEAWWKLK